MLERLNRDTRLLVLDQTLLQCQSARDALAGDGGCVRDVGWRKRRSAGCGAAARGHHLCPVNSSDRAGDAGVQSIGSAVVDVSPGDYFELVARQTSGSAKNVAADELTWFAIEVVE